MTTTVGIISDTHNLLRTEAVNALHGSDIIIHAGDIGGMAVIEELRLIADVYAVRGNVDKAPWGRSFPETEVVETASTYIYVLHDLNELDLEPTAAGFDVVIYGHSHRPETRRDKGVLYINPGSAGPRRFDLPVSIAKLYINHGTIDAEIIELQV